MCCYRAAIVLFGLLVLENYVSASETSSRQKRCIVVQKQSGTHGDSAEGGGDDEDRSPEPRGSKPDRIRVLDPLENLRRDVERIPPNLLKYKVMPTKRHSGDVRRFKNRFYKSHY